MRAPVLAACFLWLGACSRQEPPQAPPLSVNQAGLSQRLAMGKGGEAETREAKRESEETAPEPESTASSTDSAKMPDAELGSLRDGRREEFEAREQRRMRQ